MTALDPHPDRLLSANVDERDIARRLYSEVRDEPIYSPHGHVDASILLRDEPFSDPATLLVTADHYVLRLLHAVGVPLDQLGVPRVDDRPLGSSREVWHVFCSHWDALLGTTARYWLETQLHELFGVVEQPSEANADELFDGLSELLALPEYRPRALFEQFRIAVLATTDDPADDLAAHLSLREQPQLTGSVIPTFRADRYLTPGGAAWVRALSELATAANVDCSSYEGTLNALRNRRAFFAAAGATATDTAVLDASCEPLQSSDAERIHQDALRGQVTDADAVAYRGNMLYRLAAMSSEDGLVMQLHAGVLRNHDRATFELYGPDTGHDLPDAGSFTRPLTPILRDFGANPLFRIVLFTVDETTFSRDIAPLAGFYPSVFAGAPWWYLDTPAAITRYRRAITDNAGFTKTSGFIDDTRAFCSIPTRHDMSRRVDAAYLASLVADHELTEDDALGLARRLVADIPIDTFRLTR